MGLIAIDPGHGGPDPGACGFGLQEKAIALQISKLLSAELATLGHQTALTRDRDPVDELELQDRCEFCNDKWADLFVSIHCNAAESPKAKGFEIFHYYGSRMGKLLATAIHQAVTRDVEISVDRGIKEEGWYVIANTNPPAVLIETLFISNQGDATYLSSRKWQESMARAIATGINAYLKGS
jgi:N-acetylmuramoyl-L-alanine amidase